MKAYYEAVHRLGEMAGGDEAYDALEYVLEAVEEGGEVDVDGLDDLDKDAARALLDALMTYRRELEETRRATAGIMTRIAKRYGVMNPARVVAYEADTGEETADLVMY